MFAPALGAVPRDMVLIVCKTGVAVAVVVWDALNALGRHADLGLYGKQHGARLTHTLVDGATLAFGPCAFDNHVFTFLDVSVVDEHAFLSVAAPWAHVVYSAQFVVGAVPRVIKRALLTVVTPFIAVKVEAYAHCCHNLFLLCLLFLSSSCPCVVLNGSRRGTQICETFQLDGESVGY